MTTTAAPSTTYIARNHLRNDNELVSLTTKPTRPQANATSSDRHHFDIEEYDM